MTDELLPALPEPTEIDAGCTMCAGTAHAYTPEQMRAYAREAIRLSHSVVALIHLIGDYTGCADSDAVYTAYRVLSFLGISPPAGEVA